VTVKALISGIYVADVARTRTDGKDPLPSRALARTGRAGPPSPASTLRRSRKGP